MKKIISFILIGFIILFNAFILIYKYSFFSNIEYKKNNYFVEKDNLVVVEKKVEIADAKQTFEVIETYEGKMTAYGADCYGCSGITASGYDIRNNNIYYEDKTFGTVRIVAADRAVPFGTVVRVTGVKIYKEPFLAIVLDRGSAIKGKIMDLAFGFQDEEEVKQVGRSSVIYEVLRYGW